MFIFKYNQQEENSAILVVVTILEGLCPVVDVSLLKWWWLSLTLNFLNRWCYQILTGHTVPDVQKVPQVWQSHAAMANGKALYSIAVVIFGFICFIVGAIAVGLPKWGLFFSCKYLVLRQTNYFEDNVVLCLWSCLD